jgi:NADH-quinone oxidoreductase subunit N
MFPNASQLSVLQSDLGSDLLLFLPELLVCGGIVLLLLCRLVKLLDRAHLGAVAVCTVCAALFPAGFRLAELAGWFEQATTPAGSFFGGMLASDTFGAAVRVLLLGAALLTILLTRLTGIPDREDSADFYTLLLGGTLGMLLMVSANHLMMVFIAVEMASLPSYALAGFLKGKRQGSEAALKYVVYGAGASGVMLYGISLLAGTFGTGHLLNVAAGTAARLQAGGFDPVLLTGFTFLLMGFGFKLAAVPFHFWCPDVFEGAAAEVGGFLSVASKAAAVALTTRVLMTMHAALPGAPWIVPESLGLAVGVVGAITVTFGNLAAFGQTNLKRLLAYSTIAHAGYMLLGVALVTPQGTSAVLFYLVAYLLMNLGAFAVVALVRNATGSEELSAYRGLVWRNPTLAVTMAVFLLALLGLPPLAGFAGKFQVFAAVYEAGKSATAAGHANLGTAFYVLLGVGAVNTAVSAYYYLKVVRAMVLESPEGAPAVRGPGAAAVGYLTLLAALLVAAGVVWNPLTRTADRAAASFRPATLLPTETSREARPNLPKLKK